eukprot:GHVS01095085.1.p1 GENE.GHVS01095085.1~~GHVS01095085.1.p1  ORF type:complete len:157 (-),score=38.15 GHVS01095085.1:393-863(-)
MSSPPPPLPTSPPPKPVSEMFSSYCSQVTSVRSVGEWMELNQRQFGSPTLQAEKFSSGALFGFASGMAARQALKVTAVLCGMGFMSLQMLSYYGYVHIDWRRVEEDVQNAFDINKDGQVDHKDFQMLKQKLLHVLTWGMPSAAGFGTGFVLGLKKW